MPYKKNYKFRPDAARISPSEREDAVFSRYADLIIGQLEQGVKTAWRKPWFSTSQMPKNIYGREYNGSNAMLLMFLCEKEGYKLPVFATHENLSSLNFVKGSDNTRSAVVDENGKERDFVHVLKGERSFPVYLYHVDFVHRKTKERISLSEFSKLSADEKQHYDKHFCRRFYNVFNVSQTNLQSARPEIWAKLEDGRGLSHSESLSEGFSFEPMDKMIRDQQWICPIIPEKGDMAYFSLTTNEVHVPEKSQFKSGESFYSTLFHEMGHSTGHESQLNRIKSSSFGSPEYAREELVAELTAAITSCRCGIKQTLKTDSIPYVNSWLTTLKEEPSFIRTVLQDVKKASEMLSQHIKKMEQQIETEKMRGVEQESQEKDDKLDIRSSAETGMEADEDGNLQVCDGESLDPDKKQGSPEVEERRRGGLHR